MADQEEWLFMLGNEARGLDLFRSGKRKVAYGRNAFDCGLWGEECSRQQDSHRYSSLGEIYGISPHNSGDTSLNPHLHLSPPV